MTSPALQLPAPADVGPDPSEAPAPARSPTRRAVLLAIRAAVVIALYQLYAYARNQHGIASAEAWEQARRHADALVAIQDALRLPAERDVQQLVLGQEWLVRGMGAFYGTAHFAVTVGVVLLLVVRRSDLLARHLTTLVVSTFAAVAVFALYPVAPPRLMPEGQATVDTLAVVGGVWSYDHGVLERISDPFAALPSLHLGWATWCALVLWSLAATSRRPGLWRTAAGAHLVLTFLSVFVTGNHWYLDAVAGIALVAVVAAVQQRISRGAARSSTAEP